MSLKPLGMGWLKAKNVFFFTASLSGAEKNEVKMILHWIDLIEKSLHEKIYVYILFIVLSFN